MIGATTTSRVGWKDPSPPFPYYPPHPTQDFFRAALTKQMLTDQQEQMAIENGTHQTKVENSGSQTNMEGRPEMSQGLAAVEVGLDLNVDDSSDSDDSEDDYDDLDD